MDIQQARMVLNVEETATKEAIMKVAACDFHSAHWLL